jgi:hypothetical protein
MKAGLFQSFTNTEGSFTALAPEFGYVVYEKKELEK